MDDLDPNYSALLSSYSPQDWFHPADTFYYNRSPAVTFTLSPSNNTTDTTPLTSLLTSVTPGNREAALFGSFPVTPATPGPVSTVSSNSSLPPDTSSFPRLDNKTIKEYLEMGMGSLFLVLFQHAYLKTLVISGHHAFQCPHCDTIVNTSIPGSVRLLSSGQFHPLTTHYRKKSCLTALAHKEKDKMAAILHGMSTGLATHSSSSPSLSTTVVSCSQESYTHRYVSLSFLLFHSVNLVLQPSHSYC